MLTVIFEMIQVRMKEIRLHECKSSDKVRHCVIFLLNRFIEIFHASETLPATPSNDSYGN